MIAIYFCNVDKAYFGQNTLRWFKHFNWFNRNRKEIKPKQKRLSNLQHRKKVGNFCSCTNKLLGKPFCNSTNVKKNGFISEKHNNLSDFMHLFYVTY